MPLGATDCSSLPGPMLSAFAAMNPIDLTWCRRFVSVQLCCAVAASCCAWASQATAAIIAPEQVSFDASDLERATSDRAPRETSSSSSSHAPIRSDQAQDSDSQNLHQSILPYGSGSSSSSSSSSTSGLGTTVVVFLSQATPIVGDDLAIGQLPEDHGLSLPAPPGTDLLRPPRG